MKTSIVWFKNDLRINDNETLVKAIAESDNVIPVYCFDEAHFCTTKYGFKKTGSFRAQFLLESLIDLDNNLRVLGSGLVIAKGNPADELVKLATEYNATMLYAKAEIAPEECSTQKAVQAALQKINVGFKTYATTTLYAAIDLPFSIQQLPDIFSSFRKKVETNIEIRSVFEVPTQIKSPNIALMQLPTLQILGLENITMDCRAAIQFKGGETRAHERLQHYFYETKAISYYKETRNGMIGTNYSSKFSAWLANGCISPVTIYDELKKYEDLHGANESTYWLVFELLWRDYFYFVMQKFGNKLFLVHGIKNELKVRKTYHPKFFMQWADGLTKVDFIDANMLELKQTGFMSNRGRQNVASYLCNDLKMDWRYGAAYFEEQLIDYDVCSNWGNWAYLAGVGNDPRPHRYFNITKQANDYDAKGDYRKLWLQ